eukprot:1656043-Karenia_brevis.AAC.1
MVEGVTRAKGLLSLAKELGFEELSHEVRDGKLVMPKVPGEENPADLMTNVLGAKDIKSRLNSMNMDMKGSVPEEQ